MAWRIHESVVRGEIDNRIRDRVTGRIWLAGEAAPLELELTGNAWRDLAGRRLAFVNPAPKPAGLGGLTRRQRGTIGDCTAARKVKVPDIPLEQIGDYYAAKKPFPWHWANSLYLEWISDTNGRIVIESAEFQLTIDPEAAWEMSAEEEAQRCGPAEGVQLFQTGTDDEPSAATADEEDDDWAEGKPLTEEEAEKMQAESDRLADRIQARLDREGPDADYEKILEEELERRRRERGEKPLTPEEEAKRAEWIDETNHAAEEALNNPDPELEAESAREHPLALQARELSLRLMRETEAHGWVPDDASREHPVAELVGATMSAGAKLAGALNGRAWPPPVDFCATHLVRLKRGRGYLDDALLAAEACAEEKLVEADWLAAVRIELESLRSAADDLIAELRAQIERGFD